MKIMKFELSEKQTIRLKKFIKNHQKAFDSCLEESCCFESPLTYHFSKSGIGDTIFVTGFGKLIDFNT